MNVHTYLCRYRWKDDHMSTPDDQPTPGTEQTTGERLAEALDTLPPEIPRYVAEAYLIDALDALLNVVERTNG